MIAAYDPLYSLIDTIGTMDIHICICFGFGEEWGIVYTLHCRGYVESGSHRQLIGTMDICMYLCFCFGVKRGIAYTLHCRGYESGSHRQHRNQGYIFLFCFGGEPGHIHYIVEGM